MCSSGVCFWINVEMGFQRGGKSKKQKIKSETSWVLDWVILLAIKKTDWGSCCALDFLPCFRSYLRIPTIRWLRFGCIKNYWFTFSKFLKKSNNCWDLCIFGWNELFPSLHSVLDRLKNTHTLQLIAKCQLLRDFFGMYSTPVIFSQFRNMWYTL